MHDAVQFGNTVQQLLTVCVITTKEQIAQVHGSFPLLWYLTGTLEAFGPGS